MSQPALYTCSDADLSSITSLLGNDSTTASLICASYDVHAMGGPTNALLAWTVAQLRVTSNQLQETKHGLNTSFILASTYQVFMMQIGYDKRVNVRLSLTHPCDAEASTTV